MARRVPDGRPFPPGTYPVVVVGSGPGALQLSYFLTRLGVGHAVISDDPGPGGMFRRYPLYQRLNTWSKPHPPVPPRSRHYAWYDWNSLLADEPAHLALLPEFMAGDSYFPTRAEMERALRAFVRRAGVRVRYGCRWEGTRRDDHGFILDSSDGEYRCRVAVFAVGMAQPWKPQIPGIDLVPHYADAPPAKSYAGRRVLILGKRTSAFEMADALLPYCPQIILVSPRPVLLSIHTRSTAGVRARYLLPYEDHLLGGGVFMLDAATSLIERRGEGYRVRASGTTRPGEFTFEVDRVVAATGWTTPLQDLRSLGVATISQDRLPALTPFWESSTVPGIFFAGAVTQGAVGLRKHGIPSNSGGLGGFRHNARILALHLRETYFGRPVRRPPIARDRLVSYLLAEVATAAELWNQRSYLARVIVFDPARGITDGGIVPLQHFVDTGGPDAAAVVLETDPAGDHHPAVYVRRGGKVTEHVLPGDVLYRFQTEVYQQELRGILQGLL
ncbi:MAG: NAD(P)-binding domain-containing protein [Armatimonadota bacterium]|nr:NAD(P)-binding domain-containing protein [Armatimonadota bacterium]MDR7450318.1 NAD(P)-binding domain-containing protein [Armatimonadota bacterium]MDR7467099.1 NAD(P)-binding domain-containing protein [Armatimonadota bacterium]MDR7493359.1 NAD(P)-binding domain-containing protein [Armatimonadota bacterium]MDR7499367.1 NAD(P)-binding domain-containing protein [Armatimonadota bacterium]